MGDRPIHHLFHIALRFALSFPALAAFAFAGPQAEEPLTIVVMDPLSSRLACDCIQGYAQRDYAKFGQFLEAKLGRPVRIEYAENLARAFDHVPKDRVDLVVGKFSLVKFDAAECGLAIRPIAMLSGKDGSTSLFGLFVAKKADPVKTIADVKGRRILFGTKDSDEKHQAAFDALKRAGVPLPAKIETRPSCSDAALALLDDKSKKPPIGVISSYALALIEGCGQVPKGALKVIGKTGPVPFVAAFATGNVDSELERHVMAGLLAVKGDPKLLTAMESKNGFVPIDAPSPVGVRAAYDWPGWRGPQRNGIVPWLPESLPAKPQVIWKQPLSGPAHGGIAVSMGYVVVPDRNEKTGQDVFRCFRASDGKPIWKFAYSAPGRLDFGSSPRASPQIADGRVYLLGAFGHLHCLELASGSVVWSRNLIAEYGAKLTSWGMASSPLIVGDALIVNPGAKAASIVALNRHSGEVLWTSSGAGAAYASLIYGEFGGVRQIVGYDAESLGGWDPATGKRLWSIVPENIGDFNVPTPVPVNGGLAVATENNGAKVYGFGADGSAIPAPTASFADLSPDTASPILLGTRLFGYRASLICLDAANGLKPIWEKEDTGFGPYACFFGCEDKLLVSTSNGELLLLRGNSAKFEPISRVRLFSSSASVYAHPALTGERLYFRDVSSVRCLSLSSR